MVEEDSSVERKILISTNISRLDFNQPLEGLFWFHDAETLIKIFAVLDIILLRCLCTIN